MTKRYYVGHNHGGREVFTSDHTPVEADNLPYGYVTGPFRTRRGAVWASQPGAWFATIGEAERIAQRESELAAGVLPHNLTVY